MKKRISSNVDVMLVNRYGITVKKCCASCQHKCLDDFANRKCELTGHKVRSKYKCDDWQMCEQLGASESLAMQRGLNITPKKLEDIQQEFETEHGSRYLLH